MFVSGDSVGGDMCSPDVFCYARQSVNAPSFNIQFLYAFNYFNLFKKHSQIGKSPLQHTRNYIVAGTKSNHTREQFCKTRGSPWVFDGQHETKQLDFWIELTNTCERESVDTPKTNFLEIMSMSARDLLMEVSKLTELQNVRVTIKESFKGAALAGVSTLIGGLFLGPIGLAIGGTIGGCSAALMANNNFKSVPYIITHDLTPQQQKDLVAAIGRCLNSIPIIDAVGFVQNVARDPTVATTVAMAVISFLNSQPGMEILD